jgi:hypothetical protein
MLYSHEAVSVDRKVSGGVQKLYFCMGQSGDAAVQKYSFCTPGQPQNCIRGKLFDLLSVTDFRKLRSAKRKVRQYF